MASTTTLITPALLSQLPKTDLHVHLDGSLRLETLIELSRAKGCALPSYTAEGLRELVFKETYSSLEEYLLGFAYTCAVMQDEESLEQVAYELAQDNISEGVRYVEVRFAPQLHMGGGLGYQAVLRAVNRGLERAAREHRSSPAVTQEGEPEFRYGIIVCAMRMFQPEYSAWYRQLCSVLQVSPSETLYATASIELARAAVRVRDELGLPVVGFDLAGKEDGYPASTHVEAFQYAQDHFLKKTVHAGEAYGPESIFQAITALNADRVGHGYHLFASDKIQTPEIQSPEVYVQDLADYIADRRITVEVCMTSNLQTNPELRDMRDHTLGKMLAQGISATLCTDNRLMSHTTVTKELSIAVETFEMTPNQLRNTLIHGFKRSFFPGSYLEKRTWVRGMIDYYDQIWWSHFGEDGPSPRQREQV